MIKAPPLHRFLGTDEEESYAAFVELLEEPAGHRRTHPLKRYLWNVALNMCLYFGVANPADDAWDVLQATYLNALEGRAKFNPARAPFQVWMINLVRNEARKLLRSDSRRHAKFTSMPPGLEPRERDHQHDVRLDLARFRRMYSGRKHALLFLGLSDVAHGASLSDVSRDLAPRLGLKPESVRQDLIRFRKTLRRAYQG